MEFVLTVLGIVAALWGGVILIRWGFLPASLVVLLTGVCFGPPFFQVSLITLDRILVGGLAISYFVFRRTDLIDRKPLCNWDLLVGAFLIALVVSTFSHDWTLQRMMPASRLVFYYLMPAAMYWLARQAKVTEQTLVRVFLGLAAFGFYLSLTAVFEWRHIYALVFPPYITSVEFEEFLGRGRGPLLNPVGNGVLICIGLGSLAMLWPHAKRTGKIAIAISLVVFAAGIIATLTRCVWLSALIGGLLVIMVTFPPKPRISVIAVASVVLAVVLVANWSRLNSFKRDKAVSASQMSQSSELRPVLAYIALQMIADHPLTGVGFGQYKMHDKYYMSDRSTNLGLEAGRPYVQHNTFLSLLTETGLVGAGLFLLVLAVWGRAGWALWSTNSYPLPVRQLGLLLLILMSAYLTNSMFHDMSIIPMMHMILFFFGGLTIGQHVKSSASVPVPSNSPIGVQYKRSMAS